MKKYTLVLSSVILLICIFCTNKKQPKALSQVSLRQEWFPNANYAGELFAMYETAKHYGLELKLEPGSDQIDPIKLVLSGQNDFGVVSADRVLSANENGADLVVIGVANMNSPTCFISKIEKKITTPADFKDHSIGVLTGTNTELIYKILKRKANLTDKDVKEVEIPFDLATFVSGQYDVRPAFVYDEPVSLEIQGIKYNLIKPADYGVHFLGTVYFTKRSTVEKRPEVVQSFVNALQEGWTKSFQDPQLAIKYLKQYDKDIDENRETLSLRMAMPYFQGINGKPLSCNYNSWYDMAVSLKGIGFIKNFDYKRTVDTTFVNKASITSNDISDK